RAVPARRQRRDHHRAAVVALPPGRPEGRRLRVHRRVAVLHAPVATAAQQGAVGGEQGRPDRDASLLEADLRLGERDVEQCGVIEGHGPHSAVPTVPTATRRKSSAYTADASTNPTMNVTSPTPGTSRGRRPVKSSWLENRGT